MKQYSLKLRKILLYDFIYYILIILSLIYILIYSKTFTLKENYKDNNKFYLKIDNYVIDGNKLSIDFNNLKSIYYFKTKEEINLFKKNYNLGDTLEVHGLLETPNNNTIPNTFNYKNYLNHKKIKYILKIESFKKIKDNKNILIKIKNYILKRIEKIKNNSYLYAFILGKSSYLDINVYNNYKINGITHLFALSGLHVSMFSSILLHILNKLKLNEKITFTITSIFLILFSFIASFTPSILRATIFFILSSINNIYYFFIKPKNLLYLTFTILIFINPFYIFDTGFILSFTITYFILLLNEELTIEGNIKSILVVSILSLLSSLPIIINISYEVNIIGFVNNILFIPLVSNIIFPLSLMTILVPKLSIVLFILTNIMEKISAFSCTMFNIVLYFQKLNYIEIFIYYILLILSIKKSKKILIILLIFIFILYIKPYFNKNTYIYFIDVGQGDLELIVTENNESIIIDTGGKLSYKTESWKQRNKEFNLMSSSVIQFIKSIGLKKIDYLIITHGDYDHMGEAINLVNNFKVEKVIFNCGEYNNLEKELIEVLEQNNINYYSCIKELNIDKYKLKFLNTGIYDNENDNSSVIYLNYNNYKFLFMGDAGINREKDILENYNIKDIDVLKVGHHGSKTSSSMGFINRINPKYSIISVGKNNRYGHPNDSVLETLKDSKIYRTDQDGSIIFKMKNNKSQIKTCSR
ncbi:MAG: DNA internalization-related competence protein ComEC/Rec2 [Bacilli bacterium]